MSNVIGTYRDRVQAEKALDELKKSGLNDREVSLVAKENNAEGEDGENAGESSMGMSTGVVTGGAIGGVAGLLAGAGLLAIPGIGPLVALGPLAATLGGAATGGVAGGLVDMGIPEDRGQYYESEVRSGRFLVMVQTDGDRVEQAAETMRRTGAKDVEVH
ncbi:MAG: general stress protein [Firmicutes bacterium]|nr:general stress protein [Bacillota bacterium]